jgi:hypothetical protein
VRPRSEQRQSPRRVQIGSGANRVWQGWCGLVRANVILEACAAWFACGVCVACCAHIFDWLGRTGDRRRRTQQNARDAAYWSHGGASPIRSEMILRDEAVRTETLLKIKGAEARKAKRKREAEEVLGSPFPHPVILTTLL